MAIIKCSKTGGYLMINHSVKPTIGVILRTQLDEFSYYNLRQSEYVISIFEKSGFELEWSDESPDTSEYVYDHDLLKHWRYTYLFYENKAINTLANNRLFAWVARTEGGRQCCSEGRLNVFNRKTDRCSILLFSLIDETWIRSMIFR